MALDARRRQKKAEKRNAKQRAKRKELAQRRPDDMGQKLARVAAAPILHCCTTEDLWDQGIAQILVSRELTNGNIAFSVFLVDRFCLGVKDGFCGILSRSEYFEKVYENIVDRGTIVPLTPASARKLVEGAVEYAGNLGLSPHSDYRSAKWIFGDIDVSAGDEEFEFGKGGKPLFVPGPFDSPGRCASILGLLNNRCGPDGFHYIMPLQQLGPDDYLDFPEVDDDDSNDDGFDDDDADNVIEGSVASDLRLPHRE